MHYHLSSFLLFVTVIIATCVDGRSKCCIVKLQYIKAVVHIRNWDVVRLNIIATLLRID